jgi:hypothetical protein
MLSGILWVVIGGYDSTCVLGVVVGFTQSMDGLETSTVGSGCATLRHFWLLHTWRNGNGGYKLHSKPEQLILN